MSTLTSTRHLFARGSLACAIAFSLPFTLSSTLAVAQSDSSQSFNISPGPLSEALNSFGRQTGILLSYPAVLADGRQSPGLQGDYGIDEGLQRLLAGSGLQAVRQGDGSYALQPVPDDGVLELGATSVNGQRDNGLSTEGSGSYAVRGASIMKGAQSLKDIPQSVTVVTRKQMDDQGAVSLDDVLAKTPGITLVKRPGGGNDIYSRGFLTTTIQYDGVPLARGSYWGNSLAASSVYLDRVEVLRGAQGLLEGAGNPAGSVNVVRKRGLAEPALAVETRAGSWDNYGTRLDVGSALDDEKRLRSRFVVDYEDRGYFVDTIEDRNLNAYAALDFDLTADTTMGIGLVRSHLKGNRALYSGVPRYANGSSLDVSRSTYVGAGWNESERRETQVFADIEHSFNPDWKLKVAAAFVKEDWEAEQSNSQGTVAVGGDTVNGTGYVYDYSATSKGLDANLSGKFEALGLSQEIVLGANYSKQKRDDGYLQYSRYTSYNVFAVNHDAPRPDGVVTPYSAGALYDTTQKGIYGMWRAHLTDDLTLVLGARSSWYLNQESSVYGDYENRKSGQVTPYAGVIYALNPQWSVYASYADIFQPQLEKDAQQSQLEPIVGVNYEVGIKGELFDGALNTSLAIFRIDQENRAVEDQNSPMNCDGWYCYRAAGEVRSEGIELEAHGELLPGWQVSGGYTYNRNKYLEDNDSALIGERFDYKTPEHILRLWSDYQLTGALSRWSVGTGVSYQSARETSTITQQGGYSVWDGRVAYQIDKHWSASVNLNNIFDKRYYSYMDDFFYSSYFGEPRNFLLTLRGNF
ncbi:TonB-dependent siderophore receptor [Pseudomonas sp. LRF_L74]|uniref:TonB-dependent siderophore receptor n=1 Tax=Pseudomonas sp. LRF_L74 TaxID=3369422 RepID=UPI003F642E08